MIPARFTQTGRDWTTTSNGRANAERQSDRLPMSKSDKRDLRWCGLIAFALPFVIAALSTLRWS